jgi:uncharacterized protein YdcH (DUF465 family)
MYKAKIKHLEEMHQSLNTQIDDMERNHPHVEVDRLAEMKKKRLAVKDEVARLNKLQWEHDHERVDLGD